MSAFFVWTVQIGKSELSSPEVVMSSYCAYFSRLADIKRRLIQEVRLHVIMIAKNVVHTGWIFGPYQYGQITHNTGTHSLKIVSSTRLLFLICRPKSFIFHISSPTLS